MSEEKCSCDNPANLENFDPNAGPDPRVAEVEVCDANVCEVGHLLVRGDRVHFVSTEQARRVGETKLDPVAMPSDIKLPPSYVLVHDATGRLLEKCDIYIVRWRSSRRKQVSEIHQNDLAAAQDYFGPNAPIRGGFVEIPTGPWKRVARVRFIRYSRFGFATPFEHRYDPPVDLSSTTRPLAWRLPLPEGCVIDNRGFVRP
jgi:hypothetical protein